VRGHGRSVEVCAAVRGWIMANIESAIVCVDAGVAKLVQVREKQMF